MDDGGGGDRSGRCSSVGIEREGGSSSIQTYRPITVPDRLVTSTSSEVAELDMNLPFPAKLHYIISNPKYEEFITWCSHGRAWRVLKQREFEKDVIPIFFRSDKFASFMRQVNGWAFVRMTQGPDVNCYYHEMFLRGIPRLAFKMQRPPKVKNAASTARKQAGAGIGTPDFYRISWIAPLPPVIPYKIEIKLSKRHGDNAATEIAMAHPATRYVIVPLAETDSFEPLEDIPIVTQMLETQRHGDLESVSFADPFSSESGEDELSGIEESVIEVDGGVTSSVRSLSSGSASEMNSGMKGLSAADVSYLAHQNRSLMKHI